MVQMNEVEIFKHLGVLSKDDWNIINNFICNRTFTRKSKETLDIKYINTRDLENLCTKINSYIKVCYDVFDGLNKISWCEGRLLVLDEVQIYFMLQVRDTFKEEIKQRRGQ